MLQYSSKSFFFTFSPLPQVTESGDPALKVSYETETSAQEPARKGKKPGTADSVDPEGKCLHKEYWGENGRNYTKNQEIIEAAIAVSKRLGLSISSCRADEETSEEFMTAVDQELAARRNRAANSSSSTVLVSETSPPNRSPTFPTSSPQGIPQQSSSAYSQEITKLEKAPPGESADQRTVRLHRLNCLRALERPTAGNENVKRACYLVDMEVPESIRANMMATPRLYLDMLKRVQQGTSTSLATTAPQPSLPGFSREKPAPGPSGFQNREAIVPQRTGVVSEGGARAVNQVNSQPQIPPPPSSLGSGGAPGGERRARQVEGAGERGANEKPKSKRTGPTFAGADLARKQGENLEQKSIDRGVTVLERIGRDFKFTGQRLGGDFVGKDILAPTGRVIGKGAAGAGRGGKEAFWWVLNKIASAGWSVGGKLGLREETLVESEQKQVKEQIETVKKNIINFLENAYVIYGGQEDKLKELTLVESKTLLGSLLYKSAQKWTEELRKVAHANGTGIGGVPTLEMLAIQEETSGMSAEELRRDERRAVTSALAEKLSSIADAWLEAAFQEKYGNHLLLYEVEVPEDMKKEGYTMAAAVALSPGARSAVIAALDEVIVSWTKRKQGTVGVAQKTIRAILTETVKGFEDPNKEFGTEDSAKSFAKAKRAFYAEEQRPTLFDGEGARGELRRVREQNEQRRSAAKKSKAPR